MAAITFGKRNRYRFVSAGTLKDWRPVAGPAIYAATYKPDAVNRPKAHSVAYVGETANVFVDSEMIRKELHTWWEENSGINGELFIFFHEMPGSSQHERASVKHQLVLEYEPRGND